MTRGEAGRYAVVVACATSWGFWPLILRRVESYGPFPSSVEATITLIIMTAVAGLVSIRDRSPPTERSWRDWSAIGWLAIADAFNVLLLFQAYRETTVAVAVLTHYLAPIFVALAAPFVLGEKAGSRTGGAIALSFGGLVLLLGPWSAGAGDHGAIGALCGAGSACFYALNVVTNKWASKKFTTSELAFYHGIFSIPLLAAFVPFSAWGEIHLHALGFLTLGALGPGSFAGLAFVWAIRGVHVSHASTLTLIEPLVAVLLGVFVLGESISPARAVGGAVILLGAWLLISEKREL